MRNIAIIPARSGSKGLKDKNIKELCGKPLMAYSIEAAINSGIFDCVHVSTDSEKYADIAKQYGADVPFLRNAETSSDASSTWDVVDEVLCNYCNMREFFDTFAVLQPTSPLRKAIHIQQAYELYNERKAKAVVSVCEVEHSPLLCNTLNENCELFNFIKRDNMLRRQDMETFYRINGAIYISDINFYKEDHYLYREGSLAYKMEQHESVDIDTMLDFIIAECILNEKGVSKGGGEI